MLANEIKGIFFVIEMSTQLREETGFYFCNCTKHSNISKKIPGISFQMFDERDIYVLRGNVKFKRSLKAGANGPTFFIQHVGRSWMECWMNGFSV